MNLVVNAQFYSPNSVFSFCLQPVYFTSMVPFTTEEEEEAEETSAGGGDEEKTVDGQTEGKENGSDENLTASCASEQMKYRDTVKKYYLKLTDFDRSGTTPKI